MLTQFFKQRYLFSRTIRLIIKRFIQVTICSVMLSIVFYRYYLPYLVPVIVKLVESCIFTSKTCDTDQLKTPYVEMHSLYRCCIRVELDVNVYHTRVSVLIISL